MSDIEIIRKAVLENTGIELTDGKAEKLTGFSDYLLSENEKYNLTAIRDSGKAAVLHFADSLTLAEYIPENAKLCDIGAGAGFPSLPLAIYRDDIDITAIDATAKKVGFINKSAEILGLKNIKAINGRAEELFGAKKPMRGSFDFVCARAVADLGVLCELCAPAVRFGGTFAALKGEKAEEELEGFEKAALALGLTLKSVNSLELVYNGESFRRNIILFEKTGGTAEKYPRQYAQISKKPLF